MEQKKSPENLKKQTKIGKLFSETNIRRILPNTIQTTILTSFTLTSAALLIILGVLLYGVFAGRMRTVAVENTQQMLDQAVVSLEDYLVSMRRISDAIYYDVIKGKDMDAETAESEMNLMYEAHKDNLISIALFTADGELLSASPIDSLKADLNIPKQPWFQKAMQQTENLHFSTPYVEHLFNDTSYRYNWVFSLSRAVELTRSGSPAMGVLLVDMKYSTIEQMMNRINQESALQYVYLVDSSGKIIYHPKQMQINYGIIPENNISEAHYQDGQHEEVFHGEKRTVIVSTVSYTGWKMISVIPHRVYSFGLGSMRYIIIIIIGITLLLILVFYQRISSRISRPLTDLNHSIRNMENGDLNPGDIYVGGTQEVRHLGMTLRNSMQRINQLMHDIVVEQEEKQKSEMDALQSQINPHFLYNTLDSIVWMIEGEHNKDAVFMVTQLASLFRISLSRGKNIIPIEQELKHAENYMNIQKVRYKNAFTVRFDIDPQIRDYATVKLIIQPLLENAIYYGVGDMEEDDGGEIVIRGWMEAAPGTGESPQAQNGKEDKNEPADIDEASSGDIYISVTDNGYGMTKEVAENLLKENPEGARRAPRHGSGVGLLNVHNRIRLRFGEAYGLTVASEPDEGTTVTIHLPAVPFTDENQRLLESGRYHRKGAEKL
jgi:two-component system sensor histidine kinase YesM